jgi:hypothetical protein
MNPRIICTVFILATTFDAHAHFIPHYRMDSYVLLSDDIVLCEEEDVRIKRIEHETWTEVTKVVRCRAVRAFKDDMKPGTEFQIEYGPIFSPSVRSLPPGRALLFLKKVKDANSYSVVTAKFIQKDAVFQLVQVGNPGPLGLTPQKPENIKLITGQKYGETELIQDLLIALKKADSLTKPVPELYLPGAG